MDLPVKHVDDPCFFLISFKDGDFSLIDGDCSFEKKNLLENYLTSGYLVCVDKLRTIYGIGCANSSFVYHIDYSW